jgi:hypothetical protein
MSKSLVNYSSAMLLAAACVAAQSAKTLQYQSAFMRVEIAPDQPAFAALALDSLGKGKLSVNPLRPPARAAAIYTLRQTGSTYEYRRAGASPTAPPVWRFEFTARHIHLRSNFAAAGPPSPLVLNFDPYLNHATLLGIINQDNTVRLPAILHLPDLGTLRITSPTDRKSVV